MFELKSENRPIYLQIAQGICDKVITRQYSPHERIPSVRDYAAHLAVNANTVMKAFDHLASIGIIYNKRGIGYFIAADAWEKASEIRRSEILGQSLNNIFHQLHISGITPQKLSEMYNSYINNLSN